MDIMFFLGNHPIWWWFTIYWRGFTMCL